MTPYFDGEYDVFAFKDVMYMEKYTEQILKNMRLKKSGHIAQMALMDEMEYALSGVLVIFKDSYPCEYPHEDQYEKAVYVSDQKGEAQRLLSEWKAYIEAKEGIPPAIRAAAEFESNNIKWQQSWIEEQLSHEKYLSDYVKPLEAEGDTDILDYDKWRESLTPELLAEAKKIAKGGF